MIRNCPACGHAGAEQVLHLSGLPAINTALYSTAEDARRAPVGDIRLVVCVQCGLLYNRDFDPGLVTYVPGYENSQHFSATFSRYAATLAHRLIDSYGLRGGTVLEVGCGKGEFLVQLCEAGAGRGIGVDPSYAGESDTAARHDVTFLREQFGEAHAAIDADLICCRHVLEHLAAPVELARSMAGAASRTGAVVYAEVPNADFVLTPHGLWDVIYQHVSYFNAQSFRRLCERAGFRVEQVRPDFGDQVLGLVAHAHGPAPGDAGAAIDPSAVAAKVRRGREFAATYRSTVEAWENRLADVPGGSIVLWGAGAKGARFLNATIAGEKVDRVVDVNPRKWGSFVPGCGRQVVAPTDLASAPPETVIVANEIYAPEVRDTLGDLTIEAEVVCL